MSNPFKKMKHNFQEREFVNLPAGVYKATLTTIKECEKEMPIFKRGPDGKPIKTGEFETLPALRFIFTPKDVPDSRLFETKVLGTTTRCQLFKFIEMMSDKPVDIPTETSSKGMKYIKDTEALWAFIESLRGRPYKVFWTKSPKSEFHFISKIIPLEMDQEEAEIAKIMSDPKLDEKSSKIETGIKDYDDDDIPF